MVTSEAALRAEIRPPFAHLGRSLGTAVSRPSCPILAMERPTLALVAPCLRPDKPAPPAVRRTARSSPHGGDCYGSLWMTPTPPSRRTRDVTMVHRAVYPFLYPSLPLVQPWLCSQPGSHAETWSAGGI